MRHYRLRVTQFVKSVAKASGRTYLTVVIYFVIDLTTLQRYLSVFKNSWDNLKATYIAIELDGHSCGIPRGAPSSSFYYYYTSQGAKPARLEMPPAAQ